MKVAALVGPSTYPKRLQVPRIACIASIRLLIYRHAVIAILLTYLRYRHEHTQVPHKVPQGVPQTSLRPQPRTLHSMRRKCSVTR